MIEWTLIPFKPPNAHFNLHVLGGVGASYGDHSTARWRVRCIGARPRIG